MITKEAAKEILKTLGREDLLFTHHGELSARPEAYERLRQLVNAAVSKTGTSQILDDLNTQVADLCALSGAPEDAAPDAWTLRDAIASLLGRTVNRLRDEAHRIAVEHGFKDASIGEDMALIHSEVSEALEDHRNGSPPTLVWYVDKRDGRRWSSEEYAAVPNRSDFKPCGIPSEMADIMIRVLHFCGKHGIDIENAIEEKMAYNASRPFKHGGKKL